MALKASTQIKPGDTDAVANQKFSDLVNMALSIEGELARTSPDDAPSNQPSGGKSAKSAKTASVTKDDSAQKKKTTWVPANQTCCRNYAAGRGCPLGNKCRRLHWSIKDFMDSEFWNQTPQREKDKCLQILRSGATPDNPAPQATVARTKSKKATAAATTSSSSDEVAELRTGLQSLEAQVSALVHRFKQPLVLDHLKPP